MSTTVHFGSNATEFPLAAMPQTANGITSFALTPSATVTAESVFAAVKGTESYAITTDDAAGAEVDNMALSGNVGIDSGTGNILVSMRQKSDTDIKLDALGAQLVAAQLEIAALKGGASK